jgi:hypothetical protein
MISATTSGPWLSLCLLLTLAGTSAAQLPPQKPPEQPGEKPPALLAAQPHKEDPQDDELRKLLKARYNEALAEAKTYYEDEKSPRDRLIHYDDLYGRWQRLVQAGLELCDKPAEKVSLLTQYVEVNKDMERGIQERVDVGREVEYALHRARYQRLDAEIQLLRAKREVKETDKKP